MDRFFYPESIVVIGVSEKPDNLARNILANLRAFGYRGDLYAVGRQAGEVEGIPIATSLDRLPDGIDLAVILTPAPTVPDLVEACGRKGIRRVVIESGGFGEFSEEGRRLEERLLEVARRWGIRFVGPNCISVVNLETGVCLPFAPLSPEMVRFGPASVVAQSGGVSVTYLDRLSAAGVGVNKVVSIGNKTDLHEIDYLSYLLEDPGTEIVVLYLESLSDGRRLLELARSSPKPIIVHKANRGWASQRIASSHTAALADDDRIVDAAFRQAGILRAEGFRDAVAMAQALSLPPVQGNRLVIISRSGGHAVIAADAAEAYGFHLPPLPDDFAQRVRRLFRADVIALTNPIDLGVIFDFDLYARIVEECLRSLAPDAVLLINTYSPAETEGGRRLARSVEAIVRETGRPVALCVYAMEDEARVVQQMIDLPVFTEIEEAVRGLAAAREWHRRRFVPAPSPAHETAGPNEAAHTLPAGTLTTDQTLTLCQSYGIPIAPWARASTPEEAVQAADRLGYPVALKILSPEVVHKTDVGGVALGLSTPEAVREAARRMMNRAPAGSALMIQRMVEGGVEVILGGKQDPTFGPVVMFGLGGIYVEALEEVSFRVAPLTRDDAEAMIDEVHGSRLLEGVRGTPPADREGLVRSLLALSRLLIDHPRLLEIDVNPLIALPDGVVAVDARARVE